METSSLLSSLHDECRTDNYLEPHYKECYRLAIDVLIESGSEAYQEFLAKERCSEFLAEDEINYILNTVQKIPPNMVYATDNGVDDTSSSGTYWPMESDVEAPNLDLGWPYVMPGISGGTNIELLFHPPRIQPFTIKETIRKMIKEARKVIAIVMDIFTDVDIFKEIVEASTRGISVYLLLDESNFSHFLKMTEKQGCQVQRLRNMRVRTVKGQEYFSKSGAKFHGKMEQKFLLVDCKKVMYGTYSFMWSFEKANLSMVQIITGQLVESFDEEFRTLYARSSVPSSFAPELVRINSCRALWENEAYQHSRSSLASISSQRNLSGWQDKIHHLDPTILKTRGTARYGINENDQFNPRNHLLHKPQFAPGFHMQNRIQQYQPNEVNEHWKRHSYAGEKPERTPYLMLNRTTNRANNPSNLWKVPSDSLSIVSSLHGSHTNHKVPQQSLADRFPPPKLNIADRNSVVRRSFNGTDNHIRFLQQRMPTLERTTKSFLRNWRIESYLNDQSDFPADSNGSGLGDRAESYDAADNIKAHALYAHSRLRSSFIFKPTLPEQKEVNSCASSSNSTIIGSEGSETPKATPNHILKQKDETGGTKAEPSPNIPLEPDIVKNHTLQISEDIKPSAALPVAKEKPPYMYSSLNRSKPGEFRKNHQNENILKRRSFPIFDHSNTIMDHGDSKEASSYIYSTLNRNRFKHPKPPLEDSCKNSKSMHSVANHVSDEDKNHEVEPKESPTSKAVSVAGLAESSKEEPNKDASSKKENKNSPNFLKKGSQKLRSLLNLTPEKKETLSKNKTPAFYRMCSSSDTLTSESDENQKPKTSETKTDCSPRRKRTSSSNSQGSLHKSKEDIAIKPKSPKSPKPPKSPKAPKSPRPPKAPSDENAKRGPTVKPLESMLLEVPPGNPSAPRFNTEQIQYQDLRELHADANRERVAQPAPQAIPPQRMGGPSSRLPSPKPHEELISPRFTERRVYSRFEPFCKIENSAHPMSTTTKVSGHLPEGNSKTTRNNYVRSNQVLTYNPGLYHPLHPNENKFRGIMQKFGNFLYKNK
ncbi:protein FAM83B [Notechis scutatus]|uniref:Protein FAM83B n=1 Tax=Notechis scutatus TaxID=8663 RepID=A0A6J1TSS4_9SAUR|nr:protein FAM83B [Notechis scutatus]XP_026521030.1 protein FAM83B [Notechis scutatus]